MSDIVENNVLHLSQLEDIRFESFFFLDKVPVDLYTNIEEIRKIKGSGEKIDKEFFLKLIKHNKTNIFINRHYRHVVTDQIFNEITILGRAISKYNYLNFAKRLAHYISILHNEIHLKPLDDKLINYQTTAFKIWLTFVKKCTHHKLQRVINHLHQSSSFRGAKKSLACATLLYRLSSSEKIFSDHYCFNLAVSGLFSEIGTSLISEKNRRNNAVINSKIFKYSSLILSIKTNLTPQNLKMIASASFNDSSLRKKSLISGQETYYFLGAFYLCGRLFENKNFCLKTLLTELKNFLPVGHQSEFKNIITRSIEFFGWEQLPDQMTP